MLTPDTARVLQSVQMAVRAGDVERASLAAEQAVSQGHEHPYLLTLAAYRLSSAGEAQRALDYATRASALEPENADALSLIGECLTRTGRARDAIAVLERALALVPGDAALHFNLALALERDNEPRRAGEELERAFALDPTHVDAAARLAYLSAAFGDPVKARKFGQAALALDRNQAFAGIAVALADIAERKFEAARDRLAAIIATPRIGRIVRAEAYGVLGDALNEMGRHDEAFDAYAQAGEIKSALYAPKPGSTAEMSLARTRRIAGFVARAPAGSWRAAGSPSSARKHVFLMGFPRSGTTLLAHVLASHPACSLLDERFSFLDSIELLRDDASMARLAAMSADELAPLRDAYWTRVAGFGLGGTHDVFIDKMPLNCELLPLIAKLFPDAQVLFALRDPRDVVLSCFRRRFRMNRNMYEMLTLERAAAFYDATMSLCEVSRGKLELAFCDLRNEDLIGDFEGETHRLCAFLGIGYDAAMAGFAGRAGERRLSTPSATQVVRGLTGEGMSRWRSYEKQMAKVMPLLAPWVERFGYA